MGFIKKENICISEERSDGNGKAWKTIGEIVTMSGNDGQYQFVKLWGPGGIVQASVFPPKEDNQQQGQQQGQQQQAPQQQQQPNYQQQPQQQAPQQQQPNYQQGSNPQR